MTTIEYPQPNTTVARLHLSLNGDYTAEKPEYKKDEVINFLEEMVMSNPHFPSGATIIEGTGIWMPRKDDNNMQINQEKKEIDNNLIIEFWVDSKIELKKVREFKQHLEDKYNQDCVCLSLEDRYYEH